jgi:hypothetical protein
MSVREQFADDSGTDEAGGSRNKDAHVMFSQSINRSAIDKAQCTRQNHPVKVVTLSMYTS